MKALRGKMWRTLSYQAMPNGTHNPVFIERLRIERDNFNMIMYDRVGDRIYIAYDKYNPNMIAEVLSEPSIIFHDSVAIKALTKEGAEIDMELVLAEEELYDNGDVKVERLLLKDVATKLVDGADGRTLYVVDAKSIPQFVLMSTFFDWVSDSQATAWTTANTSTDT